MKLFLSLLVFSTFSVAANALTVQASCQFNRAGGRCAVLNRWNSPPIYCELRAQGKVASGAWVNGFENVTIYPGNYAYIYVQANNPQFDPIVSVSGSADCSM